MLALRLAARVPGLLRRRKETAVYPRVHALPPLRDTLVDVDLGDGSHKLVRVNGSKAILAAEPVLELNHGRLRVRLQVCTLGAPYHADRGRRVYVRHGQRV